MQIKECYVSHNGISCVTNINSLINLKNIKEIPKSYKLFNINNILFYMALRSSEIIIKNLILNKYLLHEFLNNINKNLNNLDDLLPCIVFS